MNKKFLSLVVLSGIVVLIASLVSAGWITGKVTYPLWHENYCTNKLKCPAGEGDCDSNAQCLTGLCSHNVGLKYGQKSNIDVCECASGKIWDATNKKCIVSCTDSDVDTQHPDGLNYGVKGTITSSQMYGLEEDDCEHSLVGEWFCDSNNAFKQTTYDCSSEGKVCKDGACVSEGSSSGEYYTKAEVDAKLNPFVADIQNFKDTTNLKLNEVNKGVLEMFRDKCILTNPDLYLTSGQYKVRWVCDKYNAQYSKNTICVLADQFDSTRTTLITCASDLDLATDGVVHVMCCSP